MVVFVFSVCVVMCFDSYLVFLRISIFVMCLCY